MNKKTKSVLITGGSSGIGKAIALRYATEGYKICLASNDSSGLQIVHSLLDQNGEHVFFQFDATKEQTVSDLAEFILRKFGTLDVLVNSIGVSEEHPAIASSFSDWNKAMDTNFYGVVNICRAIVPVISDHGRIINISSIHATRVERGQSGYAASKAALESFTKSLALELAPKKILVNCIAPGFIATPMSVKNGVNELETDWFKDNYVRYDHLPLKRAGKPKEVAGLAYFLGTEDASYITGATFNVDGGVSITF